MDLDTLACLARCNGADARAFRFDDDSGGTEPPARGDDELRTALAAELDRLAAQSEALRALS